MPKLQYTLFTAMKLYAEAKQKKNASGKLTRYIKARCRGADWVNKTTEKNRIRHASKISLYTGIHKNDSDLTPIILETKYDPRA